MKHVLAAILWLVLATTVQAQAPTLINYQGRLFDSTGTAVNGTVNIGVNIYTNQADFIPAYAESVGAVQVKDGLYTFCFGTNSILLQSILLTNKECWLEVVIDDNPLTPMNRLLSVPYACVAAQAINARDTVGQWTVGGIGIRETNRMDFAGIMNTSGTYQFQHLLVPASGSLVGISVLMKTDAACTNGQATFSATINDIPTELTATINTVNSNCTYATTDMGAVQFNAGDLLGVQYISENIKFKPPNDSRAVVTLVVFY